MSTGKDASVIETIYASTVLSRSIDRIMDDLEHHVVDHVEQARDEGSQACLLDPVSSAILEQLTPPDLGRHIELALQIQREIGFEPSGPGGLDDKLEGLIHPALAFDRRGAVLRLNSAARRCGWRDEDALANLAGDEDAFADILEAAFAIPQDDARAASPIRLSGSGSARCGVVMRASASVTASLARDVWILMIPELSTGSDIAAQARAAFRLTDAEAAVAARFVEGDSLDAIARARLVSLETVRAQIKSIKQKTGARDLPGLMRLLCGLASGAAARADEARQRSGSASGPWASRSGSMRLQDGRRLDYLRQGAAQGMPVLLLHNLPYGAQLTHAADVYARSIGLSITAPLRAGFCHSDPSPARGPEALLNRSADDMCELMDQLGIARAGLIGHAAGATQAIRFATRYPERVSSVLIVTRGPVWNKAWLRDVAPHHRAQSIIMRHMPGAGRLLMGATLQHFNKHGPRDYSARAIKGSPSDLAAHDDPEFLDLIGRGVTFGLRQGPEIFCREWALMELDLTSEARSLPHPIRLIYGAEDPLLLPVFAERFAAAVPKTELIRVPDAGHFLFYTHPREMLDAVMRDCASPAVAAAHHQ